MTAPAGAARLLASSFSPGWASHIDRFGSRPRGSTATIEEVERSGLKGRGGAGFPTGLKLASVAGRRAPVVVANGTEGEPLSSKDKTLLVHAPHLVLDGAAIAAEAVGAATVLVCVARGAAAAVAAVRSAMAERESVGADRVRWRLEESPDRYLVGEETALIQWLNGGKAKPMTVPPRPFERGVGGRPTVVQNVETLAHIALIARFGAAWFRQVGPASDPGTRLLTISGAVDRPGVYEVPSGFPVRGALDAAGLPAGASPAVLAGGYFGTWLSSDEVDATRLEVDSIGAAGASPGCGVLWGLPPTACGVLESATVSRWYADQNAGQCGPCVNGLPAIADAFGALVSGTRVAQAVECLGRWSHMISGRGACRHPDGAARFVTSALRVFAFEIDRHARIGPCAACRSAALLPVPAGGPWR